MTASSPTNPLQSAKPKVIVLGDVIVDWQIYDKRAADADQSLAWASPLSRDDWHYAAGFDARQCLAGAAAIHAMLWANDIAVASNVFPIKSSSRKSPENGSIFVLRERPNVGKTREERTRSYVMKSPDKPWQEIAASNAKATVDREETWRAAINLLSKSDEPYVDPFDSVERKFDKEALEAVCLWDVGRGFFYPPTHSDWEAQQNALFDWYKGLCSGVKKPRILIRTSDPGHFAHFLGKLAKESDGIPTVILVCALAQLNNGDLKGSGTWSSVWSQTYDYLRHADRNYLFDSARNAWKFHVIVAIHEDGVIWLGPDCWPIAGADRTDRFLGEDKLAPGRVFMVPGMQPGLSEFEAHGRIIGVHGLLAYSILEYLAGAPTELELASDIKRGLMRCRRLRNHGYSTPGELFPVEDSTEKVYVNYPREIWKKGLREATDLLLDVKDPLTGQHAGPHEVICKVQYPENPACHSRATLRIFHTMDKTISGQFVGSPLNCIRIIQDIGLDKDAAKRLKIRTNDDWVEIGGKPCPVDSFAKQEIQSFGLRQRISMQFGDFAMADPKEAGPMLDLAQRVRQHVFNNRYNSPENGSVFNFALFGSPGSGKSFLAREIARLIDSNGTIFTPDEFNLSQFSEPEQLTRALATIASKSVGGKVPLVLWDEFDSVIDGKRGGWLARFLMPMQDAHFFDGRQKWPIGTAVFAFIGGTFPTAEEFRAWACRTTKPADDPPEAVLLKARDFHSRLYTALDMPSIVELDKRPAENGGRRCQMFNTDWGNSYAKLARAVLLRQFFRNNSKVGKTAFLEEIDDELCKFLLAIPLRHGARSLQRLVEACLVSKPTRARMIHLPPQHFLAEHIETENVRLDKSEEIGMTIAQMIEACSSAPSARTST